MEARIFRLAMTLYKVTNFSHYLILVAIPCPRADEEEPGQRHVDAGKGITRVSLLNVIPTFLMKARFDLPFFRAFLTDIGMPCGPHMSFPTDPERGEGHQPFSPFRTGFEASDGSGKIIPVHKICWDLLETALGRIPLFSMAKGFGSVYDILEIHSTKNGCSFPFSNDGKHSDPGNEVRYYTYLLEVRGGSNNFPMQWHCVDHLNDPPFQVFFSRLDRVCAESPVPEYPLPDQAHDVDRGLFNLLPTELLALVLTFLPGEDIGNLTRACPWMELVPRTLDFWLMRFLLDLPPIWEPLEQEERMEARVDWYSAYRYISDAHKDPKFPFLGFRNRSRIWQIARRIARDAADLHRELARVHEGVGDEVIKGSASTRTAILSTCDRPGVPLKVRRYFVTSRSSAIDVIRVYRRLCERYSVDGKGNDEIVDGGSGSAVSIICGLEVSSGGRLTRVGSVGTKMDIVAVGGRQLLGIELNIDKRCLDVDVEDPTWGRDAWTGVRVRPTVSSAHRFLTNTLLVYHGRKDD